MTDRSKRFGFTLFNQVNDALDFEDYKFTDADVRMDDAILAYAVEHHRHDGVDVLTTPPAPPAVQVRSSGGAIPAGATVYYRYAWIDSRGQATLASEMAVAHIPAQIPPPLQPPVIQVTTDGAQMAGRYTYLLSAYTGTSDQETTVGRSVSTLVPLAGQVTLVLPSPPSGADGFNIYRQGPIDPVPLFVDSVTIDEATWADSGVEGNVHRGVPSTNTTNSKCSVQVTFGAPDSSARVYRSYDPTDWSGSLLEWTTSSSIIDGGYQTSPGSPPTTSAATGSAPPIDLSDMAEATGEPPPGLNVVMQEVTFTFDGLVEPGYGGWVWVCEYDEAEVVTMRARLGRGSVPAEQNLVVGLQRWDGEGAWVDVSGSAVIFPDNEVGYASDISPGSQFATPNPCIYARGDQMRAVVLQSGGGAAPTDRDLVISVGVMTRTGSETETYIWETS